MRKTFTLILIMLSALSLALISCSPSSDNTTTKKQDLDSSTELLLKTQYGDFVSKINEVADICSQRKTSTNYTENLSLKIHRENGESLTLIDSTDVNAYNSGYKYSAENETQQGTAISDESKKVSSTNYEYVKFEANYSNRDTNGDIVCEACSKKISFKVAGSNKNEESYYSTDDGYCSSSVGKEIFALLTLYCPQVGTFTLSSNGVNAILKIVEQSPVIEITQDLGVSNNKRVVMTAEASLSKGEGKEIHVNLKSATVKLVEKTNESTTTSTLFEISVPEDSEMTLILEDNFKMGLNVATAENGNFAIAVSEDDIEGKARISFNNLKVDAVFKTEGGDPSYSFRVTGSTSYDFDTSDIVISGKVNESSVSLFPLEVVFSFEGNLNSAQEGDDWSSFVKNFKIKSFKFGNYDINPESLNTLLSKFFESAADILSKLFPEENDDNGEGGSEQLNPQPES